MSAFTVKKNQIEMMRKRGYKIPEEDERVLQMTPEEFVRFYELKAIELNMRPYQAMSQLYEHALTTDRSYVAYIDNPTTSKQIGKSEISAFIAKWQELGCHHGVIITSQDLSKDASTTLESTAPSLVQHFLEEELMYNVLDHIYQPKYEVLTREETKVFLANDIHPIRLAQLPRMKKTDPVAKYLGVEKHTILRLYHSLSMVETITSRYISYILVV